MNLRTTACAVFAFSLCVFLHADEAASPSGSALDAARNDLKTLPATEKSQELLGKSTGLGSTALPTLNTSGSRGDAPASKPDPNAPTSATWLQDALNQNEAERDQRRSGSEAAREREKREKAGGAGKTTSASDPLAPYLGQWLTPRDQALLRPDSGKLTGANGPLTIPGDSSSSAVSGANRTNTPGLQTDFLPVSSLEPAKNPYLPEPTSQVTQSNSFAPTAPAKALPGSAPLGSATQPSAFKPAAKPAEAPVISPNARPVDDRKYFPQLRRF